MRTLRKHRALLLPLFSLFLPFLLSACGLMEEGKNNQTLIGPPAMDSSLVVSERTTANRVMPSFCFQLNVPWMSQMPPKNPADSDLTAWSKTWNCGQACAAMMGAYFNRGSTASWVIDQENVYLGFPRPYGAATGTSNLPRLLRDFHALNSAVYHGYWADDVVQEGARGRPVLVAVRVGMSSSTSARGHWMVFIGWDGTYMYFNDPGRSYMSSDWTAGHYRCTVDKFMASWNTQGRAYIPVWK